jgi:hypothetical protein
LSVQPLDLDLNVAAWRVGDPEIASYRYRIAPAMQADGGDAVRD